LSSNSEFFLPGDEEFEQQHVQLVNDIGKLLMSHPVSKSASFHAYTACARVAIKALLQSGADGPHAENVWKTTFTTLYPIEKTAYSEYLENLGSTNVS